MSEMDDLNVMLYKFSKGNPGALRVCFEFMEQQEVIAAIDFALLERQGIFGSDIWDLYKCCNHSIPAFHESFVNGTAIEKLEAVPGSSFWKPVEQSHA